ncbi:MAG TPA: sigma-70 family RNA polymerase sigma factor [Devosia sp.]|nr:sigma-70 family RNA polymerase sigma factor [Devosia sp.]
MSGPPGPSRDALYEQVARDQRRMIARMAAGYEADPALREDLEQDIHLQLWRSLADFAGQCSLATWTHRVAHNVCARHIDKAVRAKRLGALSGLDDLAVADESAGPEQTALATLTLERVYGLIHRLRPLDRQVALLYLEDCSAPEIAEIIGLTSGAVATRIHRLKALLTNAFAEREAQ